MQSFAVIHVKMRALLLLLAALAVTIDKTTSSNSGRVVCYYGGWAVNRPGDGSYSPDDIPDLCTHYIYSFIGVNNKTHEVVILDNEVDIIKGGLSKFTSLRSKFFNRKFIISIGGWNEGGAKYSQMVSEKSSRKSFIKSVVKFLNEHNFDGLDLDWEYPGAVDRDGTPADKDNFLSLVRELRVEFNVVGKNWELTAAVPLTETKVSQGYHVPELCQILDAVNVMSYDLRGTWDGVVGLHSALHSNPNDIPANKKVNVNDGLHLWEQMGCPANKLVVGVPFYGRAFTLPTGSSNYEIGASINATVGGGEPGPFTQERGFLAYYEICSVVDEKQSGWTKKWDDYGKCPYAYKGTQWVGYEDTKSVEIKMNWIKEKGYLGAMTWAIDLDDFHGKCGITNPLLTVMHKHMSTYTVPASNSIATPM